MQYRDARLVVSPTDLAEFMRSRFASWMTRSALDRPELAPGIDASEPAERADVGAVLARLGFEHEARVVAALRAEGRDVVEIELHGPKSPAQTLEAMQAGREVIVQAHLARDPFAGVADFLVRVPGASQLGDFHYEVWDAKLARSARPAHLLQLCCYADMLEATQGVRPRDVRVALGHGERAVFRVDEFFYFHLSLRDAFLAFLDDWRADAAPAPDPSADHGRWQDAADRLLDAWDHVSRVASCTGNQMQKLARAGIETLGGLAASEVARVAGIDDRVFARLREQARLQRDSRALAQPLFRVLDPDEVEEGKGLALLPPASPGDVVFDLEGDPLEAGGMEYLWGATFRDENGAVVYRDWWAHDRAGERAAVESFLDWLAARRARFPDLHVFHYATYETAALKRLAGRDATREAALDELLRDGVFVDLYGVVRHGLRVGEPRYSLKNVERLYRAGRAGEVTSGMESVVVYDAWRQAGESRDWNASPLLRRIRDYNEEDCRSTFELLDWLRARQAEAGIAYRARRPARDESEIEPSRAKLFREAQHELAERMLDAIPETEAERAKDSERWAVQELLAHLVEYHYRELRPVYWELFARSAMSVEERFEQPECLAGLRRTERPPFPVARSRGFEYAYDATQDTKIGAGASCRIAQLPFVGVDVDELDPGSGRIVLKISGNALAKADLRELPESLCLIAFEQWLTKTIEESIQETAARFHDEQELAPLLRDLLLRRAPRIREHAGGAIHGAGESASEAMLRAVRNLDSSVLCVQGPPGSGKTTESAAVIRALVAHGSKVGVASHSHKAIENLLAACGIRCAKVGGEKDEVLEIPDCEYVGEPKDAADALARVSLIGGTAWCFSRPEMRGRLDYLFVDEASQVSLAKVVAMSRATRNLVLVGDQRQLSQPTRAAHPGESGLSALDFALANLDTIPPDRGLFLERTHRLHPEICSFISGAFYEDRLQAAPGNERRVLGAPKRRTGRVAGSTAGILFLPVAHEGNAQASDEEVEVVRALLDELLGRPFSDRHGATAGRLGLDDILVVAPYNLQVRKLSAALPAGARVGTVDRFQGQQAPVVIVSMCASEPHLSARGIGFLFHPNRLNVAISRAQCLSVIVGEPRLAIAVCRSVEEMRLVNRVCRLVAQHS